MTKILTQYKECKKHHRCEPSCRYYAECMKAKEDLKRKISSIIKMEVIEDGEETNITH